MKTIIALCLLGILTACGGNADPDDGKVTAVPVNCSAPGSRT